MWSVIRPTKFISANPKKKEKTYLPLVLFLMTETPQVPQTRRYFSISNREQKQDLSVVHGIALSGLELWGGGGGKGLVYSWEYTIKDSEERDGESMAFGARLTCVGFSLSLPFPHRLHTLIPLNRDHLTFPPLALALTPQGLQVSPQRMVHIVVVVVTVAVVTVAVTTIRRPIISVL
jgi:hypothetical protein